MVDKIDLSPIPEIAKNIYELAKNIKSEYDGLNKISLKGIGIDGYFIGLGISHIFRKNGISLEVDPVEISSHGGITADAEKLDSFEKEYKQIILVDKRSKSGSLGAWLEKEYPEFTYAVLIDLSGKARISATNEDIKWLRWGEGLEQVYENAFEVLGLKISKADGAYEYIIEGPRENYLLDALYREIDIVVAENG